MKDKMKHEKEKQKARRQPIQLCKRIGMPFAINVDQFKPNGEIQHGMQRVGLALTQYTVRSLQGM
jgi:hypothetical protein